MLAGSIFLRFSHDDEREADRVGAAIMRRAGWDPRGMIEFLQIIRERQGRDPTSVEVFLSTHPSPEGRLALAIEWLPIHRRRSWMIERQVPRPESSTSLPPPSPEPG